VYTPAPETDPGATVYTPAPETQGPGETVYTPAPGTGPGETQYTAEAPAAPKSGDAPAGEPQPPAGGPNAADGVSAGTVIDGYMLVRVLSDQGKESTVYVARKEGHEYAFKLFKRQIDVSKAKLDTMKRIDCPYVAVLQDYGKYNDRQYEVYEYYKNGTIENIGKVDTKRLTEFVRQLNEGLHTLHTLGGWNMIHGDLKPANIFLSNEGDRLLIGDFGISAMLNGENYSLGLACGTPEFAPPAMGVVNRVKRTPAFDYGSLGLVVYFLATGRSYFKGMSASDIAETWMKGIQIPAELDTRIKMLLEGLLAADERARYGYTQVKQWVEGSYVRSDFAGSSVFTEKKEQRQARLWFGIFDGRSIEVTSVPELVNQMKLHWEQAIFKLRDANFYIFLDRATGDPAVSERVRRIAAENAPDYAVFKTIYFLSKDADIVYKGVHYGDAVSFVQQATASDDPVMREILLSGLFRYYLEQLGYPADMIQTMDDIMELQDVSERFKMRVFGYIFSKQKEYNGCCDIDTLRTMVAKGDLSAVERMTNDEAFFAWLYAQGMGSLAIAMLRTMEENP
jgi:serine/threonine protein kinase